MTAASAPPSARRAAATSSPPAASSRAPAGASGARRFRFRQTRRLDRSRAKRGGAERPSLHDKQLVVERRSLRAARSLPRAKSRGALGEQRVYYFLKAVTFDRNARSVVTGLSPAASPQASSRPLAYSA